MNARYALMDSTFRQWIADLEDTNLMREWRKLLDDRVKFLDEKRELTKEQLVDGLKRCSKGEPLYTAKRVKIGNDLWPVVYFYQWRPRKKVLWVSTRPVADYHDLRKDELRCLTLDAIFFHQVARTELAVRRRVPVTVKPPTKKKAVAGYDANGAVIDDLPF